MSESASGHQTQLDALATFCEKHLLTVLYVACLGHNVKAA